uniref:Uncharacterized protein n=1 Tax=Staphylothermus marinus TaxID=2280 RepID=A0A7C4NVZ5_STAMA
MKWLSPPDKSFLALSLSIDSGDVESTRLYRFVKERLDSPISSLSPGLVKLYLKRVLVDYNSVLNRVKLFLHELVEFRVTVCLDYWVKTMAYACLCNRSLNFRNRVLCFENLDNSDILVYCYCDLKRNISILRFPRFKSLSNIDPFLVSKHLFIECGSPLHIVEYIDNVIREKLKLLV